MIKVLRENFSVNMIQNNKGFTLIELMISVVIIFIILGIVVMGLAAFVFGPSYNGVAYTDVDGQRYYHLVHLPEEGVLMGVCAGMAYKWGIDPWIPRIGFVVFTAAGGAGILAYIVIWLLTDSAHTPPDYLQRTG